MFNVLSSLLKIHVLSSELGYSGIYVLLLALVVATRAGFGKLWFVLSVRQKSKERHLIDRIHIN